MWIFREGRWPGRWSAYQPLAGLTAGRINAEEEGVGRSYQGGGRRCINAEEEGVGRSYKPKRSLIT